MQNWKSANIFVFIRKYVENFTFNTFYFLRYAHVRSVKIFFSNIQKQQNMLKISLLLKKFTKFKGKKLNNSLDAKFSEYCFHINTST